MVSARQGDREPDDAVTVPIGRRLVSLVAAISLLVGLANTWLAVSVVAPWAAVGITVGFVVALGAVATVLAVSSRRRLERVDVGLLLSAVVLYFVEHAAMILPGYPYGNDETFLGLDALHALQHGHDPYTGNYVDVLNHPGVTPLLSGGSVTHYEYPPFTLELGWLLAHVWEPLGAPWVLAAVGLLATTAVVFAALPKDYRALAVAGVLGFGLLEIYTLNGYPIVLAMPLLCLVGWRWTSIGAGGRLGTRGVVQAVALGVASATHQLSWLVALFLAVALWTVRRGELTPARTAGTLLRWFGLAVLVFLILDAPFVVVHPHAWLSAVTAVFTQHAVPFGVGMVMLTVAVVGHSGGLVYYSVATALLVVALLGITAVGIKRIALAIPVFASVMFLLSTRSTADYMIIFAPLWLVWAATTDPAAVAASRPVRWLPSSRPLLTTWPRRSAAVAVALVPALTASVIAVASPPPLSLATVSALLNRPQLVEVAVEVTNRTGGTVHPAFFIGQRSHIARRWTVVHGPRQLAPHTHTRLTLAPKDGPMPVLPHLSVYALSDNPAALSSARVALPADAVHIQVPAATATARATQLCAVRLLGDAPAC